MPDTLQLELNKVYIDEDHNPVRIVVEYDEFVADYAQGFRFRGDNNVNYCSDGSIIGQIGEATVIQLGSVPIVALLENATDKLQLIYLGECYQNYAGMVVMINDVVLEDSSWYAKGYRYIDDMGTYYLPNGVTVTSGLWLKLNLKCHVPIEKVTAEQMAMIHKNVEKNIIWLDRCDAIAGVRDSVISFAKRWTVPVLTGIGIGMAASS